MADEHRTENILLMGKTEDGDYIPLKIDTDDVDISLNCASGLSYQSTWNANTNTPTLASGTGTSGYHFNCRSYWRY